MIGELCGDSAKQVQRYIKMTELIQALLDKVDDGSMGFTPAVQLSYLKKKEQQQKLISVIREELQKDSVPANFIDITRLGLVELTRKKVYKSLREILS